MKYFNNLVLPVGNADATFAKVAMADRMGREMAKEAMMNMFKADRAIKTLRKGLEGATKAGKAKIIKNIERLEKLKATNMRLRIKHTGKRYGLNKRENAIVDKAFKQSTSRTGLRRWVDAKGNPVKGKGKRGRLSEKDLKNMREKNRKKPRPGDAKPDGG